MAGHNNWPYIINLGNSIIGVAVLAMPFCFKQCGIILGMLVLLFCTWLTLTSCQLLMRAGIHSRRRSYEFLAYHTHGATGKFLSELGMIGMQVGTLIAQIVVIGDLGPAMFSKFLGLQNTSSLRTFLIMALCLCVGLPLGLLKDLRSVSRASTVCITFYGIFILYVIGLSLPNIRTGQWYHKVSFWRPEGFFQCLPILSFSFGCQTQLFLLYDALPDPSLKAINGVISSAVNLCAVAYLLVGFFGYVAFHTIDIPGDVISVFPNTFFADLMKICFVFSIVITFPVIIFPCRSSIYTLLFAKHRMEDVEDHDQKSKAHDDVLDADGYLPEKLFKGITIFIVVSCMILGILIPNVEFVLGINGAIMGTLICYIFPAMFFLRAMGAKHDSRGMAQLVIILGLTILMLSTYATLNSQGQGGHHPQQILDPAHGPLELPRGLDSDLQGKPVVGQEPALKNIPEQIVKPIATEPPKVVQEGTGDKMQDGVKKDTRQEPPNPDPPDVQPGEDKVKKEKNGENDVEAAKKDVPDKEKEQDEEKGDDKEAAKEIEHAEGEIAKAADANKAKEIELQEKEKKQDELLQQLEKQQHEHEKLLEEQRQLLKEFKDHHEKDLKKEQEHEKEKLGQLQQQQQQQQGIEQPAGLKGVEMQPQQPAQMLQQSDRQFQPIYQDQQQAGQQQQQQPGQQVVEQGREKLLGQGIKQNMQAAGRDLNLQVVPVRGEGNAGQVAPMRGEGNAGQVAPMRGEGNAGQDADVKHKKYNLEVPVAQEGIQIAHQPQQEELLHQQQLQQQQFQQQQQLQLQQGQQQQQIQQQQIQLQQEQQQIQLQQEQQQQQYQQQRQQELQQERLQNQHQQEQNQQPLLVQQQDKVARIKRSLDKDKLVGPMSVNDDEGYFKRAETNDVARKPAVDSKVNLLDEAPMNVVKMNFGQVKDENVKIKGNGKINKPHDDLNNLSDIDQQMREGYKEKESENLETNKRNEEMRRKLKSMDLGEKQFVMHEKLSQSLANLIQHEVGRHLLQEKNRD
ncbi:sodium-coupled neutral amino acid transporter 3 [Plakobranchus ocellatus]|uniref:Sodium-coupled neutral amino acid transporter 3 n=1 Tax=Plakobranchus ocellatus TaxID=259542 RepID=A0AAV4A2W0_9GAST|nr:sodium-coupled neutral amino acid transporter 3 [Plakobranchus ocellatus]